MSCALCVGCSLAVQRCVDYSTTCTDIYVGSSRCGCSRPFATGGAANGGCAYGRFGRSTRVFRKVARDPLHATFCCNTV
ncbi:hypothetical protein K466DRAFT_585620 [Polyporus arcularius HHB13444]|uniref:Uncharacterized protein n=1 Tax=Polyporus arcularius HHB13444 TaxID=1314778 RepID=A0A5C3PJ35_9APHY|nr:hypothetical protein K466DRAFT_585620 [Polyporus arcularius HHB13444]